MDFFDLDKMKYFFGVKNFLQVTKTFKIKPTDNTRQIEKEEVRKNRLNSIRNELEGGRINTFEQIFAIMSETRMSIEMGISFNTFRRKIQDPGEFTINEIMRLAVLIGVKYDVIADWLRDRVKDKSKSRIFRD